MIERLKYYFTGHYNDSSTIIHRKSVLLFFMNTIILFLVIPVPPLVFFFRGDFLRPLIIGVPTLLGCTFSLMLLRKGHYYISANTTSLAASVTIIIGVIYQNADNPGLGYSSMIYLVQAAVIFSALFCARIWTTMTTMVFVFGNIFFFIYSNNNSFIEMKILKTGMIDSILSIILTYALAMLIIKVSKDAMHEVQIESDKNKELNLTLEFKVEERTKDLQSAMEELSAANEELVNTRDALWGEMELAKKIQTVLLPEKPEISGYEISAYMAPADEVGGDYYDIINVMDRDWIVIGDVSGHGVSAGLVMMMVQTSIQVVLKQKNQLRPSELLSIINTTIAGNIKKLGEDKYMTITVLACYENGRFYFSGLHQDIMIYRSREKRVELVETTGMWIGLMNEISGMITDDTLELGLHDTMLLYTDGITEAVEKTGAARQMFGEEKLALILRDRGEYSTDEIKTTILNELRGYNKNDDVTLVAIKRLK